MGRFLACFILMFYLYKTWEAATHQCHGHHQCTTVTCSSFNSICVHGECRCTDITVGGIPCVAHHHVANTHDPNCQSAGIKCSDGHSPGCHKGHCSCTHDSFNCSVVNDCIDGVAAHKLEDCVNVGGVHGFWHCAEELCKCIFFNHTDSTLVG
ncbi:serine protease inhibitor Cvsi-1-like [Saccostrea echinata]|uniref:serine protease inhibitor Cvsi-1-like n=1 Tax=Saccostrea echinata TaxID=191078 RepID=UPI002A7F4443|nr:serine protease inhibitor Cvsi-1-like [Saccostrea echinata]